jgi:type IV pilus assembly protein PilC
MKRTRNKKRRAKKVSKLVLKRASARARSRRAGGRMAPPERTLLSWQPSWTKFLKSLQKSFPFLASAARASHARPSALTMRQMRAEMKATKRARSNRFHHIFGGKPARSHRGRARHAPDNLALLAKRATAAEERITEEPSSARASASNTQFLSFFTTYLPSLLNTVLEKQRALEKRLAETLRGNAKGKRATKETAPAAAPSAAFSVTPEEPAQPTAADSLLAELGAEDKVIAPEIAPETAPITPEAAPAAATTPPPASDKKGSATPSIVFVDETPEQKKKRLAQEKLLAEELQLKMKAQKEAEEKRKAEELAKPAVETGLAPKVIVERKTSALQEFLGSLQYLGVGSHRLSIVQNLGTMLNAGLPLIDALKTLALETRTKVIKKMLARIVDLVESGSPLWRAFEAQHFFSPHAIALVRIGEEAGNLAENMGYLALQQEKDSALRQKVKMAMIYPIIVLTLMFIIVMGLGLFVLPSLIQVLYSLNVPLPLVTRLLIGFTNLMTAYGTIAVPGIIVGVILTIILAKFTKLKVVMQWVLFRVPGVGRLAREATIARFGVILGGLLQAGVPLVEAIHSLAIVTPIVSYKHFYEKLLEHINLGDTFSKSFAVIPRSAKILPLSVQQLIVTGERSGSLSKIMMKIADIYEKKANDTAQKLPVILEPLILLIIGAMVATIAFAIIVPIYSIVGNVQNG